MKPATLPRTPRPRSGKDGRPPGRAAGPVLGGLLAGLGLGLLSFAPAHWVARALPAGSPVQLSEARGSLWQGSARVWLTAGPGSADRAALPQRLHWKLQVRWTGLDLALQAPCCIASDLRLALRLEAGTPVVRMADGSSSWPAHTLTGLGTPWNTLQPSGRLGLRTEGLALHLARQGTVLSGRASLDIQDFGSALSTLQPLGSYRLTLTGGPATALELQTLQGGLLLSGQGQWQPAGLQFRGEARAAAGREEALGNILNIIGRRDGARTLISLG